MNIVWNEVSCGNLWHFLICPRYAQGWECSNEQDGSIVRFLRSESDQTPEKGLQEGLQQVSSPGSDFGLRGKLSRLHISRQAGLAAQGQVSPAAALQAAPRLVSLQAPRRCLHTTHHPCDLYPRPLPCTTQPHSTLYKSATLYNPLLVEISTFSGRTTSCMPRCLLASTLPVFTLRKFRVDLVL